jgi:hypothetical protein
MNFFLFVFVFLGCFFGLFSLLTLFFFIIFFLALFSEVMAIIVGASIFALGAMPPPVGDVGMLGMGGVGMTVVIGGGTGAGTGFEFFAGLCRGFMPPMRWRLSRAP